VCCRADLIQLKVKVRMIFLLLVALSASVAGLEVGIEDYYGSTIFQQGIKQTVTCTVEDPDPAGAIHWRIGDRLLDPRECSQSRVGSCFGAPLQQLEDEEGVFQQSLTFEPTIEDDGKDLVCEFLIAGQAPTGSAVDKITLVVYQRDLEIVQPEPAGRGDSSTIQVVAKLYPAPREEDFLWRVEHFNGDLVAELAPGETDPLLPGYQTSKIQDKGSNNYLLTFTIVSMSREEAENRYTLTVRSPEPAKILKFNIPFLCEPGSECQPESSTVNQNNPGNENNPSNQAPPSPKKDGEVATSNIGLFIIVGLLVLCLILCIIFCAVRRKRKTPDSKRAASDGKGAFAAVGSKDPLPPAASV